MEININKQVQVRLTDFGKKCLEKHHKDLAGLTQYLDKTPFRCLLWELMNVFGEYCYNGAIEMPFKDNVIEIIDG